MSQYNLKKPPHLVASQVARCIEAIARDVMLGPKCRECIEQVIVQYVDELTKQDSEIAELMGTVKALRALQPVEFKALWTAKCLPHSGIHISERAPGQTDSLTIKTLLESGLIVSNPDRPRFYILSEKGKKLIGEPDA